eukprot:TRINITY_DN3699_c0_g1_i1.p1 TRINITY_DN3699_c0_g1~~TRINITY_DN3699_c0_g1_i1.p1  ORF type:complete len:289 (-),score=43.76 TRINITY_DN3699_c0_g1_i1:106-972(-)
MLTYRYAVKAVLRMDSQEEEEVKFWGLMVVEWKQVFWSPWSVSHDDLEIAQNKTEQPTKPHVDSSRLCNFQSVLCTDELCFITVDVSPGEKSCYVTSTNTDTSEFSAASVEGISYKLELVNATLGVTYCFGCHCDNNDKGHKVETTTDGQCIIFGGDKAHTPSRAIEESHLHRETLGWMIGTLVSAFIICLCLILYLKGRYKTWKTQKQYTLTEAQPHVVTCGISNMESKPKRPKRVYSSVEQTDGLRSDSTVTDSESEIEDSTLTEAVLVEGLGVVRHEKTIDDKVV